MPVLALFEGIKIYMYPSEHPPPHLHALYAEFTAQVRITPFEVIEGSLPPAKLRAVWAFVEGEPARTARGVDRGEREAQAGEDLMAEIVRLESAVPLLFGVVQLAWQDGYAAVVDLRGTLAEGDMFAFLRAAPETFAKVALDPYGNHIYWLDPDGDEIAFGTQSLRRKAERQAEILRLAS